jgi:hypothetical protein
MKLFITLGIGLNMFFEDVYETVITEAHQVKQIFHKPSHQPVVAAPAKGFNKVMYNRTQNK